MGSLVAAIPAAGKHSNKPYCGRGGRSGVILPLFVSEADADRPRKTTAFLWLVGVPCFCTVGHVSGVVGVVYS